jgi:hypothetical protein
MMCVLVAATAACSDDAAELTTDAGPDGGDTCPAYPEEPMPLWENEVFSSGRRVSFAALCPRGCPESFSAFMADLECMPAPDGVIGVAPDDFDGGMDTVLWFRSEGCGRIQFSTIRGRPRTVSRNFDAQSGELIGYAYIDDVIGAPPGADRYDRDCASGAWIAGEFRTQCADEQFSICEERR